MPDPSEHGASEIDRLWAKVGPAFGESPPALPGAGPGPAPGQELAWETVSLLKRQHGRETRYWAEVLDSKEKALQALRERQAFLEVELNSLRQKVQSGEERLLSEGLDVQARMEAALSALNEERTRFDEEQRTLRAMLEQARERIAAEVSRSNMERRQWEKKEQQYLLDIRELQTLAGREREEGGQASHEARRLSETVKEAKNALEKTLAELLREKGVREEAEKERAQALKRVEEVERHFSELSQLWEEERAQWRELLERERSSWRERKPEAQAPPADKPRARPKAPAPESYWPWLWVIIFACALAMAAFSFWWYGQ